MGEPAMPSAAERAELLAAARAIVKSVRDDAEMPLPEQLEPLLGLIEAPDVEAYVFRLAQLSVLQAEQMERALAGARSLRDRISSLNPEITTIIGGLRRITEALEDV